MNLQTPQYTFFQMSLFFLHTNLSSRKFSVTMARTSQICDLTWGTPHQRCVMNFHQDFGDSMILFKGSGHFSHVSVSNVFSVEEDIFFSQWLHDTLASLDVSMKDLNRFPVHFGRLDFINIVLGKSRNWC